jgi:hypothetical protein
LNSAAAEAEAGAGREQPPPYPEHSILKSHLVRADRPALKPLHQWTISKKDIGDYHEEQILFTNENLHASMRVDHDINYGPGIFLFLFSIRLLSVYLRLVWCPVQNKRIAPLSFFHGCRKRRLKD